MTPFAALAWFGPAHVPWLHGLLARTLSAALALAEMVADKLPFMPARTLPGSVAARLALAATAGYLLTPGLAGALCGALGGIAGTFAGYYGRRALTVLWKLPDLPVALGEDVLALGLAYLAVTSG